MRKTIDSIYEEDYIRELLSKLVSGDKQTVILTGVGYKKDTTGVVVYKGGNMQYYEHVKIEKGCHGTGDVYASAFVGALLNGKSEYDAARIAADFTVACILNTQDDADHWYGVKFEPVLGKYIEMLK